MGDTAGTAAFRPEPDTSLPLDRDKTRPPICAVDLFCGAGGLTRGLEESGIDVTLGVDAAPICRYPYTRNNRAAFLLKSVQEVTANDFPTAFRQSPLRLLAGCAPCQPFSTYSRSRPRTPTGRWNLLDHFGRLVREAKPHLVTMENVPMLERERVFSDFVEILEDEGFSVAASVVDCADYGVPQNRRRLVVLASTLGPVRLAPPTTPGSDHRTVRSAIGDLPRLDAGQVCSEDPLHRSCKLSPLNVRRIRASRPGGTWRDWDEGLRARCHRRPRGRTYRSVYGRMTWDQPSPTVTTQYYGFGNGRFGHPEQDRAISLREGAILQSFPRDYRFVKPGDPMCRRKIGSLVGNAVPVDLGYAVGASFVRHVRARRRPGGP